MELRLPGWRDFRVLVRMELRLLEWMELRLPEWRDFRAFAW